MAGRHNANSMSGANNIPLGRGGGGSSLGGGGGGVIGGGGIGTGMGGGSLLKPAYLQGTGAAGGHPAPGELPQSLSLYQKYVTRSCSRERRPAPVQGRGGGRGEEAPGHADDPGIQRGAGPEEGGHG